MIDSIKVSQELLDSILSVLSLAKMCNIDDTKGCSLSDETVDYWPLDDKHQSELYIGIAHQSVLVATDKNKDKKDHISRQPKEVK